MDQREETVLQCVKNREQLMDQVQEPTQGPVTDSGDEWDTDLETDTANNRHQSLSPSELYLQTCLQTGAVPVSSFLKLVEVDLNLSHRGVGPRGAKALATALLTDKTVTNLELEHNNLQAEGMLYLVEMLQTNMTIQSINLSNNQLNHQGAEIMSKMLLNNYYMKSIKLSGNHFDDSAAKCLADVLEGDYVVKELDLSHNLFGVTGGVHLGHMLATNVGIEVLDLSWNHLCMGGAAALSAGLKGNSTLKKLQLSWNGFGQVEAESLGQALKHNHTLVLLDLSSNLLDDKAVMLLCQGLSTNETLRVLKLSHNLLTNTGALTLLKTIKNNRKSSVEELDISSVFVWEEFLELLEAANQSHPNLHVRYMVMKSVTRNLSALQIFQKFFEARNENISDFFQKLDKDGTMTVSTSTFRKALKEANVPLDHKQLEWLIKKFDKKCTATILYRQFAELS